MNEDPIVAEVRRAREKLARHFNFDIHLIFADLRARENKPDPLHPLVTDATQWAAENEDAMALREKSKK